MRYTLEERNFLVMKYLGGTAMARIIAQCQDRFGKSPNEKTIRRFIQKLEAEGSLQDLNEGRSGRVVTQRTLVNIRRVANHFENNPRMSIRRSALILNMSPATLQRILRVDLNLFAYKHQTRLPLSDLARAKRLEFGVHFLEGLLPHLGNMWFTDESIFTLTGHLNKQNNRVWSGKGNNPHAAVDRVRFPQKVMIWAAMSTNGIRIVPIRENIVTSASYIALLQQHFIPLLHQRGLIEQAWIQQDGARPHTAIASLRFLMEHFQDRIVSHKIDRFNVGCEYPPYSPDLNPCDFFLWGYLKDRVYRDNFQNLDELEDRIQREVDDLPGEMITNAINSMERRVREMMEAGGGRFRFY